MDRLLKIFVSGGNQPEIDFLAGPAPDALDDSLFQDPQQLALQGQSQGSDLVQKKRPTIR